MLLLEKVDGMTLAAMQAGDEAADYMTARANLHERLEERLPLRWRGVASEEAELRAAVGLGPA